MVALAVIHYANAMLERGGTIWRRRNSTKRLQAPSRSVSRAPKKRKTYNVAVTYNQRIPWAPNLCPDGITVRLTYATSYQLTFGTQFDKIMSGNGLYDPDVSGSGHQPLGFDEWMAFYDRYRVLASTCTVNTINTNTTAGNNLQTTLIPTNQQTAIANADEAEELPDAEEANAGIATGPAEDMVRATKQTSTMVGVPNIKYATEYSGTATSNPTQQWYWRVYHEATNGTTLAGFVNINIVYTVEFYQKKMVLQS